MSRYRFIAAEHGRCPVRRLCQVLGVPANGFYAWQQSQQRAMGSESTAWKTTLVKFFGVHKRRLAPAGCKSPRAKKGIGWATSARPWAAGARSSGTRRYVRRASGANAVTTPRPKTD